MNKNKQKDIIFPVFQTRCDAGIGCNEEEKQLLNISCGDSNAINLSSSKGALKYSLFTVRFKIEKKRREELGYSANLINLLQKLRLVA